MFKLKPSDRLGRWKSFRNSLNDFSIGKALELTNELWSVCPFIPFYLDVNDPKSWPDPWQLLQENYYCDIAKSLGIVYTIYLTKHQNEVQPEIRIYLDSKTKHQYSIAYFCQGKYVLNLVEGQVVNKEHINQDFKLIRCYTAADLQLEKY